MKKEKAEYPNGYILDVTIGRCNKCGVTTRGWKLDRPYKNVEIDLSNYELVKLEKDCVLVMKPMKITAVDE